MKCMRCSNEDELLFYKDDKGFYCRKCVAFGKLYIGEAIEKRVLPLCDKHVNLMLPYELTQKQKVVSKQLQAFVGKGRDVLVYAACGAGKTEIVMPLIAQVLNEKKTIGFAISRREVVLELKERLSQVFPMLDVIAVCEGYTNVDEADLVICTTHQLYRYPYSFDVLILDEIDAFPYAGNPMLESMAKLACKGVCVYLTATPDHALLLEVENQNIEMLTLFERPHGYPLVVPKVRVMPKIFQYIYMIKSLHLFLKKQPVLVFVPTIEKAKKLTRLLSLRYRADVLTSKSEDKEQVLSRFKEGSTDILVATTILERGITINDVQVIIVEGNHRVFRTASLVQMLGRVGRKKENPTGYAAIYCEKKSEAIVECIETLKRMNDER